MSACRATNPHALGATTRYEFGEAGVRCAIDLPLDARHGG